MTITSSVIWFQTVAPIKFPTFLGKYTILVYLMGLITSIFFVEATKIGATIFDNPWTLRFLAFSFNTVIFAGLTHFTIGADFSAKTISCLVLSVLIVLIQCFWK